MQDPYASVAETYDVMINWPARLSREQNFLANLLPEWHGTRVLDVGCGTGHHSGLFANFGADVIGLDPSDEMLKRAFELFPIGNPHFIAGSLTDVSNQSGSFDLIAVLGNTLAYARDADELVKILQAIHEKLTPRGQLCIQVVNYDNLPIDASRWLSLIHRTIGIKEYLFLREYRQIGKLVEFTLITLCKDETWSQHTERSLHLPITSDLLCESLNRAGFSSADLYGDYQRTPYSSANSTTLIAIASTR